MSTADAVARYFITTQDADSGEGITHLKLQKLLYYAQGHYLALYGRPLFGDTLEAWPHGPVVRSVYDQFKRHGRQPIPRNLAKPSLAADVTDLLDNIAESYGQFSALTLRNMTHREAPWQNASGDITLASMASYFRAKMQATPSRRMTWTQALTSARFCRAVDEGLEDVAAGRTVMWSELKQSLQSA